MLEGEGNWPLPTVLSSLVGGDLGDHRTHTFQLCDPPKQCELCKSIDQSTNATNTTVTTIGPIKVSLRLQHSCVMLGKRAGERAGQPKIGEGRLIPNIILLVMIIRYGYRKTILGFVIIG
jgi:hypothetical protein